MQTDINPEFVGYFEGLRSGKISFPFCKACGRSHWYPMPLCPHCLSDRITWRPVSGTGKVWSWTVVRHAFDKRFTDKLPYVVALITFEEAPGIRLVANLEGATDSDLRIGLSVELVPPTSNASTPPTVFRPVGAA